MSYTGLSKSNTAPARKAPGPAPPVLPPQLSREKPASLPADTHRVSAGGIRELPTPLSHLWEQRVASISTRKIADRCGSVLIEFCFILIFREE